MLFWRVDESNGLFWILLFFILELINLVVKKVGGYDFYDKCFRVY